MPSPSGAKPWKRPHFGYRLQPRPSLALGTPSGLSTKIFGIDWPHRRTETSPPSGAVAAAPRLLDSGANTPSRNSALSACRPSHSWGTLGCIEHWSAPGITTLLVSTGSFTALVPSMTSTSSNYFDRTRRHCTTRRPLNINFNFLSQHAPSLKGGGVGGSRLRTWMQKSVSHHGCLPST